MKSGVRKPTVEELAIINGRFSKREIKEDDIYVFDVEAANDETLTAYFSRLGSDMIEAFHANVQARQENPKAFSVGYLFGHRDDMIPSGTLFKSALKEESKADGSGNAKHFRPTVFMLKNLNVGGINTDDYIKAYEAGHTEAVSVGFIASSYICDICNNDIRNWLMCEHVPGRMYNTAGDGETPVMKLATYTVHQGWFRDRNLLELSGVYCPALPGAQIDSSGSSYSVPTDGTAGNNGFFIVGKDGEAKPSGKVMVSRNIKDFKPDDVLRFNHQGDGVIELVGRVEKSKEGETQMEKTAEELKATITQLESKCKALEEKIGVATESQAKTEGEHTRLIKVLALSEADKADLTEKVNLLTKENEALKAENTDLKKQMDEYINSLKKEATEWDVRLNGSKHDPVIFKKEIDALSIEDLRKKIQTLKIQVAEKYPAGRHSMETRQEGQANQVERPVHDRPELYRVG